MSIKGVLVTLEDDRNRAEAAIRSLRKRPGIEVGELMNNWLPLVIDSSNESESKMTFRWIEALDGVYFVDTLFSSVEGHEGDDPDLKQI